MQSRKKQGFRLAMLPTLVMASMSITAQAATEQVRVVWDSDPARNAVIGFSPKGQSSNAYVLYGQNADETKWQRKSPSASYVFDATLESQFVRLSNLVPDSTVYFKVCDDSGCGPNYLFKTAANVASDFTFVAGGDSRSNASTRRSGNQLVSKVRPLFVMFGGDLTYGNEAHEVSQWLTDWQSTFSQDVVNGKSYLAIPALVPTVGNHESNDHTFMCKVFGIDANNNGRCELDDTYYAFNVGGNQLRVYTLNTEFRSSGYQTQWSRQKSWLSSDLSGAGSSAKWRISQYHKPMFPRTTAKGYVNSKMFEWASDFYNKKMNLAVESDSHLVKYSWPVKPASNDMEQVTAGTVFIGEGSWGAPTRPADRYSPWIADQSSFAQFKIVQMKGEEMWIRTARFSGNPQALSQQARENDPLALPTGLSIWNANGIGDVYRLGQDSSGRTVVADAAIAPEAKFVASCNQLACRFDGTSSVGADLSYSWNFGDQNSASGAQVSHNFSSAGQYSVTLSVQDGKGQSAQFKQSVTVQAQPDEDRVLINNQAKTNLSGLKGQDQVFTFTNEMVSQLSITTQGGSGDVDLLVKFGAVPAGADADCRPYKNGNNESCDIANAKVGTYYIVLNGYDNYSGVSLKVVASQGGSNQPPVANFTSTAQGLSLNLVDNSSDSDGEVTSWQWLLGDGSLANGQVVSHNYQAAGNYTVKLTVTDDQGASHSVSKTINVASSGAGNTWSSTAVYEAGDQVTYQGEVYQAQWWNKGVEPGASQWGPWQLISGGTLPTPTPTLAPTPTPTVAPSVTPTVIPTTTPTQAPGNGCTSESWNAQASYGPGDEVSYNNQRWKATWYSTNLAPGSSNAWSSWENLGSCN
ncbi:PKD domain-containing protein [Motilimonas sp. E26]|uniref:PKD domain-containing protein n=1 Tax=Motilimonas sp. E26 TaxID=2865674 RepID=UPI00249E8B49|nr:PKD domain-containing protein [Motilimonas sp. E26]MCE0556827.1 PKD domain-containing protein [Motilimonas sp. E26]